MRQATAQLPLHHVAAPMRELPLPEISRQLATGATGATTGERVEELPPQPAPEPCSSPGCETLLPYVWDPWPATMSRPGNRGRWSRAEWFCAPCKARMEREERERKYRQALDAAGLPERWHGLRFNRFLKQADAEPWVAFRDRLDAHAATNGPTLGITTWNGVAAATARDWFTDDARKGPKFSRGEGLLLTGPTGGGKTTITACMVEKCVASEIPVYFIAEADLFERINAEREARPRQTRLRRFLEGVKVLVLDDVGTTERIWPWHRDLMEGLLVARYNARRPTVMTSNLRLDSANPKERTIAGLWGERVASRLIETLGGRRHGPPQGYIEILGWDWRGDAEHLPESEIERPVVATPTRDWRMIQAGDAEESDE